MGAGGGEEGGAGDEGVDTGGEAGGGGGGVDAAVDFDAVGEGAIGAPAVEGADFFEGVGDEFLAAEAGPDGHDEDQLDGFQVGEGGVGGGAGIEGEAALAAEIGDAPEGIGDVVIGFDVDGDVVGAGFGEGFDVLVGVGQHQVGVEEEVTVELAEVGHGLRAEAEVGDEVPVHDIEVEPPGPGGGGGLKGVAEGSVVARKDRGGKDGPVGRHGEMERRRPALGKTGLREIGLATGCGFGGIAVFRHLFLKPI